MSKYFPYLAIILLILFAWFCYAIEGVLYFVIIFSIPFTFLFFVITSIRYWITYLNNISIIATDENKIKNIESAKKYFYGAIFSSALLGLLGFLIGWAGDGQGFTVMTSLFFLILLVIPVISVISLSHSCFCYLKTRSLKTVLFSFLFLLCIQVFLMVLLKTA